MKIFCWEVEYVGFKLKYKIQKRIGKILFRLGFKPNYSTGICGSLTAGYGELSFNGYWQYPIGDKEISERRNRQK